MEQEAAQTNLPTIAATGLLSPSDAGSTLTMLKNLPTSLTDVQFEQVKAIAKAPLPCPAQIGDKAFEQALMMMATSLARRTTDPELGEVQIRVYRRCLVHLSAAQMWWTVEEALKRNKFFPTVKELLDIAEGWVRRDEATEAQRLAKLLTNREVNRRLAQQSRKPAPPLTQDAIDAMAPELRKLGLKLGHLIEVDGKVIANPEPEGTEA